MADGIRCLHCGWQETEHRLRERAVSPEEYATPLRKELPHSLETCPGYEPDNPALATELADQAAEDRVKKDAYQMERWNRIQH